jgi:hypothetical protein
LLFGIGISGDGNCLSGRSDIGVLTSQTRSRAAWRNGNLVGFEDDFTIGIFEGIASRIAFDREGDIAVEINSFSRIDVGIVGAGAGVAIEVSIATNANGSARTNSVGSSSDIAIEDRCCTRSSSDRGINRVG